MEQQLNPFERIANLSPLPIIDLSRSGTLPQDGLTIPLTSTCQKNLRKGSACMEHYETLSKLSPDHSGLIQCPYGFASALFRIGNIKGALTGFIPYPRIGGNKERIVAKRHVGARVPVESIERVIKALSKAEDHFKQLEGSAIKGASMALHEIRKLNRTIKQTSERICRKLSPQDPDKADPNWVKVWKASELMSNEYDVIEVLADESQAKLPLHMQSQPFKLLDKLVRIYNGVAEGGRKLLLRAPDKYSPKISVCEKTFHIIPSVFIENALKYADVGSNIYVNLEPDENGTYCWLTVSNESVGQQILDERVFQKGYRANTHRDGSGNGLYVAQLIADQHGSHITVQSQIISPTRVKHIFRVKFKATA